jgi:predicted enzyme related to lactoylglutathione lyase
MTNDRITPMSNKQAVTGIGGVFFKAKDPTALAQWYQEHLGVPVATGATYAPFTEQQSQTVWATFPLDTTYFAPSTSPLMINYRVADLDAMVAQLRAAGATVDDKIEDSELGRFGWATDPEGNRFELWQPPKPSATT